MAGGFVLLQHEDERKYDLVPRNSIVHGKIETQASVTYRVNNGPELSRVMLCAGSKTACLTFLANLGGELADETDLLNELSTERPKRQRRSVSPSAMTMTTHKTPSLNRKIKKERLTEEEMRESINKKKPTGGRKGYIPIFMRSRSPSSHRTPPPPSLATASVPAGSSSPNPAVALPTATSSVSVAEFTALKQSMDDVQKKQESQLKLIESISDRMLTRPGVTYTGPEFIEAEEVAHLSLLEHSDRAFVRELFDRISDDEDEKKLQVEERERVKVLWVEQQFRLYRHPQPDHFGSAWKEMVRQFKKTLKRREESAQAKEAETYD